MAHRNTLLHTIVGGSTALLLLGTVGHVQAQARLVLNNNGWVRIDNGAWLVIQNGNPNAITTLGTGGNIRSEGEFNRIRWQTGANTGTYVIPFSSDAGKIPFTCEITAAGAGAADRSMVFSTYNHHVGGATWDNYQYRPSDVTHMNNWFTGVETTQLPTPDQSAHVVDRFWIVDHGVAPWQFTGAPAVTMEFTYIPTDDIHAGNAANGGITAASPLGAQRFNTPAQLWGDLAPGIGTPIPSGVSNVVVPPAEMFRSWTLSDLSTPLPVMLTHFDAQCAGTHVVVEWRTASEENVSHFVVERSTDGSTHEAIGQVAATGSIGTMQEYTFVDPAPVPLAYYRVRTVDMDGTDARGPMRTAGCDADGGTYIVTAWDEGDALNVVVNAHFDQDHVVRLFDASGKEVRHLRSVPLSEGPNTVRIPKRGIAEGIYVVRFDGPQGPMARRVPLF
ncbi:MAG: hypothetical protein RBT71_11755 [Flavobacteriales bacterium]|jgi:hypothetical protein|nr:hypothetical protein [Flavobacteriales bacterium]